MRTFVQYFAAAAAVAAPMISGGEAHALTPYVKASIGDAASVSVSQQEADGKLSYGAAFGLDFGRHLRVEAGADHIEAEAFGVVSGDATVYSGTVYLDVPLGDSLEVFGGVGANWAETDIPMFGADGAGHGWQYAFGASVILTERMRLEGQWRRMEFDSDLGGGFHADASADVASIGLRLAL